MSGCPAKGLRCRWKEYHYTRQKGGGREEAQHPHTGHPATRMKRRSRRKKEWGAKAKYGRKKKR